jgi:hypothetical protein
MSGVLHPAWNTPGPALSLPVRARDRSAAENLLLQHCLPLLGASIHDWGRLRQASHAGVRPFSFQALLCVFQNGFN